MQRVLEGQTKQSSGWQISLYQGDCRWKMWRVPDNVGSDGDKGHIFPKQDERLKLILDFMPVITHHAF